MKREASSGSRRPAVISSAAPFITTWVVVSSQPTGRSVGMIVGAIGLLVPALWSTTLTTTVGISFGALGIGALFVVASVTALGQVSPQEAGIASGLLSTFHEIGASVGVATVSSIAVVSLTTGGDAGFKQAFLAVAIGAFAATVIASIAIPGRARRSSETREATALR